MVGEIPTVIIMGVALEFPNAVVLNAVVRRNTHANERKITQMCAKERKRKSAKRAQKGAKERKRGQKSAYA